MRNACFVLTFVVIAGSGCSPPAEQPPANQDPGAAVVAPPCAPPAVLQTHRAAPVREPIAAWSLTASDGSGLRLVSVEAKAVIEGPLAFTELHLWFHNPEDRVREGTFSITLPSRAAVSRFALAEGGHFKEAEVVPKALARRAYDDFLHRGIDPAILEAAAGNEFTARVYPIAAHDSKHIVISYSQELAGDGYLLPLRGLPTIDDISVTLDAVRPDGSHQTQALTEHVWQPDHDFVANVVTPAAVAAGALVAGTFEVDPNVDADADRPAALTVLVDTSASRAPGFRRYLDKVRALVNQLAERYDPLAVEVVAFDQETRAMYSGPARGFGDAQIAAFVERRAAGASDLAQAVASLPAGSRIALITDGVITAGLEGAALANAFRKRGAERVDVILAGGIRDEHVATLLSRAGARPGDVFDLDRELEPIASGLGEAVRVDVPIEVAGATWFHPHTLASLRPGTQVMVFARMASPSSAFAVTIGGSQRTVAVAQATPALLERAAARVEIDELEATLATTTAEAPRARLQQQIEKRSVAARVVSTQATMLVLDSDDDYARYGIDRKALADILVIGPRGLEQSHRTFVASQDSPHRPSHAQVTRDDLIAAARSSGALGTEALEGRYGTLGHGSAQAGSYGMTGHGAGMMRSRSVVVPTVSIAAPVAAAGSLDKSFIRRYVRRHLEKITYRYERELLGRPRLQGTLQTHFTIGPAGHVLEATATGVDEKVAACVAGVIKDIEFPAVNDSTVVVVNYPFIFRAPGQPEPAVEPPPSPAVAVPSPSAATLTTPAVAVPSPAAATPTTPAVAVPSPAAATPTTPVVPAVPAAPAVAAPSPSASSSAGTAPPAEAPAALTAEPAATDTQTAPAAEPAAPAAPASDAPEFGPAASALDNKLAHVMKALAKRNIPNALALAKT